MQDEPFNDFSGNNTLFRIQVGRRFVDEVNIGWDTQAKDEGDTLEFTAWESLDFVIKNVVEVQWFNDVGVELGM